MANSENLDLKRLDGPKTTKFDYDLYVENNFEKVDAAMGAPPSTLTTDAKTIVPAINELKSDKVDKVEGKGLSTNDFDNTYKQKIDTDIPAQLAEKVQNFKIKNEMVNGDFSQGLTGWTPGGSANAYGIVDGQLKLGVTTPISGSTRYSKTLPLINDNVYYVHLLGRLGVNSNKGYLAVRLSSQLYQDMVISATMKKISLYHKFKTGDISTLTLYFEGGGTGNESTGYSIFDNIVLLDLTDIFGAGNEPTKLEMDELMKIIPNQWWDGELTLTQKQYMTWLLNLQRENTNAIIALGGTIV